MDLITRGYNFDFYPGLNAGCTDDPRELLNQHILNVGGMVDRVLGRRNPRVPSAAENMARTFRRMYQDELDRLTNPMAPPSNSPPLGTIAQLQQWIQQLDDFIASLP